MNSNSGLIICNHVQTIYTSVTMLVVTFLDKSINSNDMNMKIIPDTKHDGFVQTNPPPRHHDQECPGGSLPRKGDNLISY